MGASPELESSRQLNPPLPPVGAPILEIVGKYTDEDWAAPLTHVIRHAGVATLELFIGICNETEAACIEDVETFLLTAARLI